MLLEALAAALIPVGVEGAKQLFAKFSGGVKATTIDEQIKLDANEINRLEALAKLDNPGGTPSQWVVDLRASARYIMAGLVILVGISIPFFTGVPTIVAQTALEGANIAFGFLFGTRIVSGYKK